MTVEFFNTKTYHQYLPGFYSNVPTWDDVIRNIDHSIQVHAEMRGLKFFGMVCKDASMITQKDYIEDLILKHNPDRLLTKTQLYLSMSSKSQGFGKHNDTTDVWFWQCIGQTTWTVYDTETVIYTLSPGDMIYVPKAMYHDVKPLSPRAGLSFGIK